MRLRRIKRILGEDWVSSVINPPYKKSYSETSNYSWYISKYLSPLEESIKTYNPFSYRQLINLIILKFKTDLDCVLYKKGGIVDKILDRLDKCISYVATYNDRKKYRKRANAYKNIIDYTDIEIDNLPIDVLTKIKDDFQYSSKEIFYDAKINVSYVIINETRYNLSNIKFFNMLFGTCSVILSNDQVNKCYDTIKPLNTKILDSEFI